MLRIRSVVKGYGHLFSSCLLAAAALGGLLLFLLLRPSYASSREVTIALAATAPQALGGGQISTLDALLPNPQQSRPFGSQDSNGSTTSDMHTVFLPTIARAYWPGAQYPLGVQVYDIKKEVVATSANAGVQWLHIPYAWFWVEPTNTTPDKYKWPQWFDDRLAQWSAQGVRTIFTLVGNPAWAATYDSGPIDKVDVSELAEFMAAAVEHYSVPPYNVEYWEFYIEPDNGWEYYAERGWGYFGNNPQAYVDILAGVYGPMKAADPGVQIVLGGLAYDNWGPTGPFVQDFLDKVLEYGGADYFDVMNFHYYLAFQANWAPYGKDIIGKANFLRDKLLSYGVQKPMICTESGMWTLESQGGSDEKQSRYVPKLYARAMAAQLEPTIWFQLIDNGGTSDWGFGLLDVDLNPKPSYTAYTVLSQQLSPAKYVRTWTVDETGSDQVEAYEFLTSGPTGRTVVAWTDDGSEHSISIEASQLLVVDKFGGETTISDGSDGKRDGIVKVTLTDSPVYLHLPA